MPDVQHARGWVRFDDGWECHIMPIADAHEHTNEADCPCRPWIERAHPDTGVEYSHPIFIHHAWDLREVLEQANAILQRP